MKKGVLFVDDEPLALDWIKMTMRPMTDKWDMSFVDTAERAMALMEEIPFDAIISGIQVNSVNGAHLLEEVLKKYPRTIRFILSRHPDQDMSIHCAQTAHQVLSKPCDPDLLRKAIGRALEIENWPANESVIRLVSRMTFVPSLPALYTEVTEELKSPTSSIESIGRIVSRDVGMTTKVLQLVNSAFFGLRRRVSDPTEAALFLGVETLKALFLAIHVFTYFEEEMVKGFSFEQFNNHSVLTGLLAKKLVQLETPETRMREDALCAGMLHDVGKLLLATNQPTLYSRAIELTREKRIPYWRAERELMGTTHAEVGAYLLGLWGLPAEVVEAVASHHTPNISPNKTFSALTAVHVANHLQLETMPDDISKLDGQLDLDYLKKLGLTERYPLWREKLLAS